MQRFGVVSLPFGDLHIAVVEGLIASFGAIGACLEAVLVGLIHEGGSFRRASVDGDEPSHTTGGRATDQNESRDRSHHGTITDSCEDRMHFADFSRLSRHDVTGQ